MKNSTNKKNGLRKVMIIVGICFVLGLFSECLGLSDETNGKSTENTTEAVTESLTGTEATSDEQITSDIISDAKQPDGSEASERTEDKKNDVSGKSEVSTGSTTDDLSGFTVTFLDVGQGNAVLFSCDGHYMMMDGGPSSASSFVVAYLKKHNIESLDYVIASHYDSDHISGLVGVLNVFDTETFIGPDYDADTKIYDSLMDKLAAQNLTVTFPKAGDTYTFGDAVFTIVAPITYSDDNENDNSVGIRMTYGDTSFLIYGDGEEASEQAMIASGEELSSDVLMVSHHGSRNATTKEILEAVKPSYAVISVGADNSYGHPTEEVLDRLADAGCTVYRTDQNGTIRADSDGKTITFVPERRVVVVDMPDMEGNESLSEETTESEHVTSESTTEEVQTTEAVSEKAAEHTYIINTNTGKFHEPSCRSVKRMNDSNKKEYTGSRDDLIAQGYDPCKNCNP